MKDNWRSLKIGEEINILSGYPFNSKLFNNDKEGKPLIRIRDILNSSIETFYSGPYLNLFVIKKDDILVGMDGEFHVSKWNNIDALLNQRILKISQKKDAEIDIDYFYYYLFGFLKQIHNITPATTVKHLSTFDIKKAVASFPPVSHQRKIAKILNTADAVIAKTGAAIAKYRAIKQGMMQDLFTRGINLQTGQLRPAFKVAPHLYKETQLGWIPKEWEVERLDQLTNKIIDGTHHTPTYTETGVPFLRVTDVQTKSINFNRIKFVSPLEHRNLIKRCNPEKGDILYSKNGTIGIPKIVDWEWEFSIFVSLALIKPIHNEINNQFLASLLSEEVIWKQIRKRAKQGTVTNLHLEEIREFLIPQPDMKEQKEIAIRYLSIQRKIENEQANLAKHQSLKKGLMQDLLTGKVEVEV